MRSRSLPLLRRRSQHNLGTMTWPATGRRRRELAYGRRQRRQLILVHRQTGSFDSPLSERGTEGDSGAVLFVALLDNKVVFRLRLGTGINGSGSSSFRLPLGLLYVRLFGVARVDNFAYLHLTAGPEERIKPQLNPYEKGDH